MGDARVTHREVSAGVALIELDNGDTNYVDTPLIAAVAATLEGWAGQGVRVALLASRGRHFCAGADLTSGGAFEESADYGVGLYGEALRLMRQDIPLVALVGGAAVGAGLGLALACDFRVAADDARFVAPFARLGLHHGFGLTATLPHVIGAQRAAELLFTGRTVDASEALAMGLCDRLTGRDELRDFGIEFAAEIAASAPIAVRSIRRTLRAELLNRVAAAITVEQREQSLHRRTADFTEGRRASQERRVPRFVGR